MKTIIPIFLLITLFNNAIILSQGYSSPYPIIFVHGLNSNDETWDETLNYLGPTYGTSQVFHAVINAYSGLTSIKGNDGILGTNDDDVLFPSIDIYGFPVNQLQIGSLFVINFNNFWNENSNDPRIMIHDNGNPGITESAGNESAIIKQGYALSKCIKKVLEVTTADKVILVGHSMGGVAIREYLQRTDNNGIHIWWQNPDINNGHNVAKVVTIGTPHGGSDHWSVLVPLIGINPYSEAVRDLRTTFDSEPAIYLYGGNESLIPILYPLDVNCNGIINDNIYGLNNFLHYTLPAYISYTWIVSDYNPTGIPMYWDGVVNLNSQYISSDTLMTDKFHTQEPKDYQTIIRGLDEPSEPSLAYEIANNSRIKGFITYQKNYYNLDIDLYKIVLENDGILTININGSSSSGVGQIALLDSTGAGDPLIFQPTTTLPTAINYPTNSGTYYIRVRGLATNISFEFPYTLTTSSQELNLITPNGDENYTVDSSSNIEWSSNNVDNVKLELSTDNGLNWTTITSSFQASLGGYSWIVPNTPSEQCLIRISDTANLDVYDVNDATFSITLPPFRIISPNGGENWSANSIHEIKWNINNIINIKIELSTNGGTDWSSIVESTPSGALSYNWTVSNTPSTQCKIRISDVLNPLIYDISDNIFSIITSVKFLTKKDYTIEDNPRGIAVGDFNQDTKLDIAVTADDNTLSIFINNTVSGTTTLAFDKTVFMTGDGPRSITIVDFNDDGKLDIAIGNMSSHTVSVLLNNTIQGNQVPTFTDKTDFPTGRGPISISTGDFNWDGKPDIVAAANSADSISVLLNTTITGAMTPSFLAKIDFSTHINFTTSYPQSIDVADFNGDGNPDIAVCNFNSYVHIFLNTTIPGEMIPSFAGRSDFITGSVPRYIFLTDLNGDSKTDIITANENSNNISVLLNTTTPATMSPTFTAKTDFLTGNNPIGVSTGDFNGDGKQDISVANTTSNTVSIFLNTTSPGAIIPTFFERADFNSGVRPSYITVGDFNLDGKIDFAVTNYSSISIFLNDTEAPLSVELIAFSASLVKNLVVLYWQTVTEVNNYGFEIERKKENMGWTKIGFVQGYGNSNSNKYYSLTDENLFEGKYFYRLKQIDTDGKFEYSTILEFQVNIRPNKYSLEQNYPNPFNPTTKIKYSIPVSENVLMKIYDILGREVEIVLNEYKDAGIYEIEFDGGSLTSGLYFYKITTGNYSETRKMILIR